MWPLETIINMNAEAEASSSRPPQSRKTCRVCGMRKKASDLAKQSRECRRCVSVRLAEKYKNDSEFRARVKARSKARYQMMKEIRAAGVK